MARIDYRSAAAAAARKYRINPNYFSRQIGAESNFNPSARSPAGAIGIAQIMPGTARGWGVNPNDPLASLDAAARAMSKYLGSYKGDWRRALAVYNAGPRAVQKYGGVPPYAETQRYIQKILGGEDPYNRDVSVSPGMGNDAPFSGEPSGDGLNREAILQSVSGRGENESLTSAVRRGMISSGFHIDQGAVAAGGMSNALGKMAGPSKVLQYAQKQLGIPYSWGGGSPSGPTYGIGRGARTKGFDCSALIQAAWAQAGVKIPRTTFGQIRTGVAVPNLAAAKPGDLLFPGPGHVQMYLGNGKVIEAPFTGGRVQIAPVRSSYIAIRRPVARK